MTIYREFCKKYRLTEELTDPQQLGFIAHWSHENISQDICFEGSDRKKYGEYIRLVSGYLDNFLKIFSKNISATIPEYGNLNAVQYAAKQGYHRILTDKIVAKDPRLNTPDTNGMTPLHFSAIQGHVFTTHALLAKGADPTRINHQNSLPIHSALFVPMFHDEQFIERKEKIFEGLYSCTHKAVDHRDSSGNTLLHLIVTHTFPSILKKVLDEHPELLFLKNNASQYPIHIAILNRQIKPLSSLLAMEGVALLVDSQGRTPLHYAACYGTAEMVQRCLDATRNWMIQDAEGKTAYDLAREYNNQDALIVLGNESGVHNPRV